MNDSMDPRFYYYSTYHLARDFIGTAAPFTFFMVLALILFPPISSLARQATLVAISNISWLALASAGVAYLLVAFIMGAVANRIGIALADVLKALARLKKGSEYARFWGASRLAIEDLYGRYIIQTPTIWVNSDEPSFERLARLCHYFKLYNPSGFQHLYRDYSFVFMYRQAAIYTLLFLGICMVQGRLAESIGLAAGFLAVLVAMQAGIREVVHGAYQFIFSTASWLEHRGVVEKEDVNAGIEKSPN